MHSVESILKQRMQGRFEDSACLALAVEGGGMAGTVSAGMCVALEQLGAMRHFDLIVGSSAGALNGSYSSSGQATLGATNYTDCATPDFIGLRNTLRKKPYMNLDFLFKKVMSSKPYRLKPGQPQFACIVASLDRPRGEELLILDDFTSPEALSEAVRASCHMPGLAGRPPVIEGERVVDGGLIESIPYRSAQKLGATHVMVLRSYSENHRKHPYRPHEIAFIRRICPEAEQMVAARPALYNHSARELQQVSGSILQLAPSQDVCGSFERNPAKLREALRQGAQVAKDFLGSKQQIVFKS